MAGNLRKKKFSPKMSMMTMTAQINRHLNRRQPTVRLYLGPSRWTSCQYFGRTKSEAIVSLPTILRYQMGNMMKKNA